LLQQVIGNADGLDALRIGRVLDGEMRFSSPSTSTVSPRRITCFRVKLLPLISATLVSTSMVSG
jgi:hypothetical protein